MFGGSSNKRPWIELQERGAGGDFDSPASSIAAPESAVTNSPQSADIAGLPIMNDVPGSNLSSASSSTTALPFRRGPSSDTLGLSNDKQFAGSSSEKHTSRLSTSVNVMKTIIGAGIFSTPFALQQCGFGSGLILIVLMGVIFYWSIMTLVKAAVKSDNDSFQSLVRFCFGWWGENILNNCLFLNSFGSMCAYTLILGDTLPPVLQTLTGTNNANWFFSRRFLIIFISVCILLPISCLPTLAHLVKFSKGALVMIVVIIISVLAVAPTLDASQLGDRTGVIPFMNADGVAPAISFISFAYVCQQNILLNYSSLRSRSINRFKGVALLSLIITVILTIIIGQAYLFFREKTSTNVLNNFPANSGIINACRLLFAIDMCATYPLEAFVARDTIEASFFKGKPGNDFRRIIISVFLVVATTSIGMFVCSLGIIYDLTGGVAASMIAFIFPSACWLKIHRMDPSLEKLSRSSVILHLSSIVFGFVILIMSLITSSTSQKLSTSCSW